MARFIAFALVTIQAFLSLCIIPASFAPTCIVSTSFGVVLQMSRLTFQIVSHQVACGYVLVDHFQAHCNG